MLLMLMTYATFNFPPPGDPYNPLQRLTYFGVVFLLGPFMIATGSCLCLLQSLPQFPRYQRIFRGRQTARSLHFLGLLAFILFIIVHLTIVIVERFPENMGNIVLGNGGKGTGLSVAVGLFALLVIAVIIVHVWATGISLKRPRLTQNTLDRIIMPVKQTLFGKTKSNQQFYISEVSKTRFQTLTVKGRQSSNEIL